MLSINTQNNRIPSVLCIFIEKSRTGQIHRIDHGDIAVSISPGKNEDNRFSIFLLNSQFVNELYVLAKV